jgi:hypothetical protein
MKTFTPTKEQFEILFQGFILGGHLVQQKGLTILKRELSVLDRLESISEPCKCGRMVAGEPDREWIGGDILLDKNEHEMLLSYVAMIPWSTGKASRLAVSTIEALKNASEASN